MKACISEDLYKLHKDRLLALIQSKVQDTQQAEDLLHDSFERLESCCAEGCECERPKSYLFRIAMNRVMDFFKARKKEAALHSEFSMEASAITPSNDTSKECDLLECINNSLAKMSLENRIAYTLVDIEQRSQVEVAKSLNIPLSTLKSRVQRTRKALREEFEECCPNLEVNCK